jgi:hypothetical protein
MCTLANEYLFIGSRLGDSLLIAYSKELPFEDQPAAGTTEVSVIRDLNLVLIIFISRKRRQTKGLINAER